MNETLIKEELNKIIEATFALKTDKQLWSIEELSRLYKDKCKGMQPEQLRKYNSVNNRKCKLTPQEVIEIRKKYNPYQYGKMKLAKEYGVSKSVIIRIIKGVSWKDVKV